MKVLRMSDLALAGKRVLIREDLNVPVKDGLISSDARIRAALPTLRSAMQQGAHELRAEYCVLVTGTVRTRPAGNENPELPTGQIEVVADDVEVLSEAEPLPFPVEGSAEVSEDVRLKYRYLDIRREDT